MNYKYLTVCILLINISLILTSCITDSSNSKSENDYDTNWVIINLEDYGLLDSIIYYDIAIDQKNNKWIGTNRGLIKFNDSSIVVFDTSNSNIVDNSVYMIRIDDNGILWLCSSSFLKFDGVEFEEIIPLKADLSGSYIYDMAIEKNNNKWLATNYGLIKYNDTTLFTYTDTNSSIPNNRVESIAIDSSGNKWLCVYPRCLAQFNDTDWVIIDTILPNEEDLWVDCITIDNNDTKWIGTFWAGLIKYSNDSFHLYNTMNSDIPNVMINSLIFDDMRNEIWIGTEWTGVVKLDQYDVMSRYINFNDDVKGNGALDGDAVLIKIDKLGYKWILYRDYPGIMVYKGE